MHPTAPRLAAHPLVRLERRVAAPFAAIGRVDSRAGALATSAMFALIGVAAALVAATHLGELAGMSSVGRAVLIGLAIAWIMGVDSVEPLGLRVRQLAGSLAGEVDTHRPIAAAWFSAARVGFGTAAGLATVITIAISSPLAGVAALVTVACLASQAESVARRRAWALGDASGAPSDSGRSLGRDEDLIDALTGGPQRDLG